MIIYFFSFLPESGFEQKIPVPNPGKVPDPTGSGFTTLHFKFQHMSKIFFYLYCVVEYLLRRHEGKCPTNKIYRGTGKPYPKGTSQRAALRSRSSYEAPTPAPAPALPEDETKNFSLIEFRSKSFQYLNMFKSNDLIYL